MLHYAAGVVDFVDSDTQTTVVDAPATAAAEVGSMATFSPLGARLVSVAKSQTPVNP